MSELSPSVEKHCKRCGVILTSENWYLSSQRRYDYICRRCEIIRVENNNWQCSGLSKARLLPPKIVCRVCGIELTDDNWHKKNQRGQYICHSCDQISQHEYGQRPEVKIRRRAPERKAREKIGRKKWYDKNMEVQRQNSRGYYWANRIERQKYGRRFGFRSRRMAIAMLGGACVHCSETRPAFLTIGHKNDDGAEHRRRLSGGSGDGFSMSRYLVINKFPEEEMRKLQVECWNFNESKTRSWLTLEPGLLTRGQRRHKDGFIKCLARFGDRCVCCGERNPMFLTLGHKNNNGNQHRKKLGSMGGHTYEYLVTHGFDTNGYELQTECWNCNLGKSANGGICPHKTNAPVMGVSPMPITGST